MSKYDALWAYVGSRDEENFRLSFAQAEQIAGVPIDHSFLTYKKELMAYGYQVGKISLKEKSIQFVKL